MIYNLYIATAPDGRKYVGCTSKSVEERWRGHHPFRWPGHTFAHYLGSIGKDRFQIEHVASAVGASAGAAVETALIRQHGSLFPGGFNRQPGGPVRGSRRA